MEPLPPAITTATAALTSRVKQIVDTGIVPPPPPAIVTELTNALKILSELHVDSIVVLSFRALQRARLLDMQVELLKLSIEKLQADETGTDKTNILSAIDSQLHSYGTERYSAPSSPVNR
jgi:hypothetical protein